MTALPNPFLSASDGLHPLSSVAAASGIPCKPQGAAAEILNSPDVLLNLSEIEPSATLAFASGETPAVIVPRAVAADRIDDISEIFTFARGLMRDYQPDFQALLNEIAPFPMEYLPDYRLGDDDQPLFLQGAVA